MFREPPLPVRLLRKSSYPGRYVLSITIRGAIRTSRVPKPVVGSVHDYTYSLALVANGVCAIRYDDEAGKGNHMRVAGRGVACRFTSLWLRCKPIPDQCRGSAEVVLLPAGEGGAKRRMRVRA